MSETRRTEAAKSFGERLHRIGQMRLWGKRRPPPRRLTDEERLWRRIEVERAGANVHVVFTAHAGFFSGVIASVIIAMAVTAPHEIPGAIAKDWWVFAYGVGMAVGPLLLLGLLSRLNHFWVGRATFARPPIVESHGVRRVLRWVGILIACLVGGGLIWMTVVEPRSPMWFVVGLIVFGGIFGAGLYWRTGRDLHCRRCWYPAPSEPSGWLLCSECGADLTRPIAVVRGRNIRRPWLALIGLLGWLGCAASIGVMLAP